MHRHPHHRGAVYWDGLGASVSLACAVHCAALPLAFSLLPSLQLALTSWDPQWQGLAQWLLWTHEAERLVVLPNLVAGCRIWACGLDFGAAPAGLYINPDATHGWTTGATEQPWLARVQDPDTGTYQPSWALQYYTDDPPDPDPGSGGGGAAVPPGRALRTPPMRIKWRRP